MKFVIVIYIKIETYGGNCFPMNSEKCHLVWSLNLLYIDGCFIINYFNQIWAYESLAMTMSDNFWSWV